MRPARAGRGGPEWENRKKNCGGGEGIWGGRVGSPSVKADLGTFDMRLRSKAPIQFFVTHNSRTALNLGGSFTLRMLGW